MYFGEEPVDVFNNGVAGEERLKLDSEDVVNGFRKLEYGARLVSL